MDSTSEDLGEPHYPDSDVTQESSEIAFDENALEVAPPMPDDETDTSSLDFSSAGVTENISNLPVEMDSFEDADDVDNVDDDLGNESDRRRAAEAEDDEALEEIIKNHPVTKFADSSELKMFDLPPKSMNEEEKLDILKAALVGCMMYDGLKLRDGLTVDEIDLNLRDATYGSIDLPAIGRVINPDFNATRQKKIDVLKMKELKDLFEFDGPKIKLVVHDPHLKRIQDAVINGGIARARAEERNNEFKKNQYEDPEVMRRSMHACNLFIQIIDELRREEGSPHVLYNKIIKKYELIAADSHPLSRKYKDLLQLESYPKLNTESAKYMFGRSSLKSALSMAVFHNILVVDEGKELSYGLRDPDNGKPLLYSPAEIEKRFEELESKRNSANRGYPRSKGKTEQKPAEKVQVSYPSIYGNADPKTFEPMHVPKKAASSSRHVEAPRETSSSAQPAEKSSRSSSGTVVKRALGPLTQPSQEVVDESANDRARDYYSESSSELSDDGKYSNESESEAERNREKEIRKQDKEKRRQRRMERKKNEPKKPETTVSVDFRRKVLDSDFDDDDDKKVEVEDVRRPPVPQVHSSRKPSSNPLASSSDEEAPKERQQPEKRVQTAKAPAPPTKPFQPPTHSKSTFNELEEAAEPVVLNQMWLPRKPNGEPAQVPNAEYEREFLDQQQRLQQQQQAPQYREPMRSSSHVSDQLPPQQRPHYYPPEYRQQPNFDDRYSPQHYQPQPPPPQQSAFSCVQPTIQHMGPAPSSSMHHQMPMQQGNYTDMRMPTSSQGPYRQGGYPPANDPYAYNAAPGSHSQMSYQGAPQYNYQYEQRMSAPNDGYGMAPNYPYPPSPMYQPTPTPPANNYGYQPNAYPQHGVIRPDPVRPEPSRPGVFQAPPGQGVAYRREMMMNASNSRNLRAEQPNPQLHTEVIVTLNSMEGVFPTVKKLFDTIEKKNPNVLSHVGNEGGLESFLAKQMSSFVEMISCSRGKLVCLKSD